MRVRFPYLDLLDQLARAHVLMAKAGVSPMPTRGFGGQAPLILLDTMAGQTLVTELYTMASLFTVAYLRS